jgi:hypothetical protein
MFKHPQRIIAAAAVLVYLTFAAASAYTHRPQIDEGMFASPVQPCEARPLWHDGARKEKRRDAYRRADVWVMPMFLLTEAAAFKAFPFSIVTMWLVNVMFGPCCWRRSRDRVADVGRRNDG